MTHTETKVKENGLTKILKGRDPRNNVNSLQTSKTTNKNTINNLHNEQLIKHYSDILKSQHKENRNKQNNININVKTNRNAKTNPESAKKNQVLIKKDSMTNHKAIQKKPKTTITKNNRIQNRRSVIFKRSSKK